MAQNLIRKKEENKPENGWFWKAFLILGLLALVFALVFMITRKGNNEGKRLPSHELHHFIGKVGADLDIHMSILIDGANVKGLYYYDGQRKKGNHSSLKLRGDKNGNRIQLTETCDGKTTGWFDGNLASGVFKGSFTLAKDGKLSDFNLEEKEGGPGFFTENEINR